MAVDNQTERMRRFAQTFSELDRSQILQFASILFNISEKIGFDENVNNILKTAGAYLNVSRTYIFEDDINRNYTNNTYEWCNEGIEPQIDELQMIPYEIIAFWPETLKTEHMICADDIHTLPDEVVEILEPQGILSIAVYPIIVDDQKIIGFIGFDECVQRRRWSEHEITYLEIISKILSILFDQKRQRTRLKQLFDDHPYAQIFCREEDLGIIDANDAFLDLCGYTKPEILGISGWDFGLFDFATDKQELIEYLKVHDWFRIFESKVYSKDGTSFTGLFAGQMIKLSGVRTWLIVITDISKRKELIADIEDKKNRLEQIIDATGIGTWEWEIKTGKVAVNEEWAHMLGYTLEDLEPVTIDTWTELLYPEDREKSESALNEHFKRITSRYECEVRMKHRDGSLIWINDKGRVSEWDEEGNPVRMFGTHFDITSRKREEVDLENSFNTLLEGAQSKSDFLSQVTHEFRTPLNIIHSLNTLMLKTDLSEQQQTYLKKMEKSAHELYRSISNLLDHTKIEAGKFSASLSDFSFPSLLSDLAGDFAFTSEETGIALKVTLASEVPEWIYSDGNIMKRILQNLFSFAFSHAGRDSIYFLAERVNGSVSDTLDLRMKIFIRGDNRNSRIPDSTGAEGSFTAENGLYMLTTQELVGVLAGKISMEKIGLDTTIITVDLPLKPGRKTSSSNETRPDKKNAATSDTAETSESLAPNQLLQLEIALEGFSEIIELNEPAELAKYFENKVKKSDLTLFAGENILSELSGSIRRYRFAELQNAVTALIDRIREALR